MYENINSVQFNRGTDSETRAEIRRIVRQEMMMEEGNRRRREKEMEQRITENVMKNIRIQIQDKATEQLRDMLNGLNG